MENDEGGDNMKRFLSLLLVGAMILTLAACGGNTGNNAANTTGNSTANNAGGDTAGTDESTTPPADLTETQKIIQEAQTMTLEELAQKAIEESNGKTFYGVGNSSRGKSALPLFIEYLQTIDPSYTMEFDWQQPKNNKIFDQLTADSLKDTGTFAMTLIQDGNQIESKMVQTGILDTFIPKDWADANGTTPDAHEGYLPLQTLNKVFMYNNTGSKSYDNCWDFVAEGEHGLFMDIDSEIVGKNFLYMLTRDDYAAWLKEAFEALSTDEQTYFQPTITAITPWPGSSCGWRATTPRPTTAPSATPWWTNPPLTSSAFWCTPSCAPWRSPPPSPRTTSPSRTTLLWLPITTATPASAASATATICSSPTTAPYPGPPAPSSPT